MSLIKIESSPISSSGNCYITSGQTVNFSVVSGITGGVNVTYEWYLTRGTGTTLVSIFSGFTLTDPQPDDEVYVNIINCVSSGGIIDIPFYFNDVTPGVSQIYYLDLSASFNYKILSAIMRCDGDMYYSEIQIDGNPVMWTGSATSFNISSIIGITNAISSNDVLTGNIVTLFTSGTSDTANIIQGKLKVMKTSI